MYDSVFDNCERRAVPLKRSLVAPTAAAYRSVKTTRGTAGVEDLADLDTAGGELIMCGLDVGNDQVLLR